MSTTIRRTRERAVLRAAFQFVDSDEAMRAAVDDREVDYLGLVRTTDLARRDLCLQVNALKSAGVSSIDEPSTKIDSNPRDTSVAAKFAAAPKAGSLRRRIVLSLAAANSALGGQTCDELETYLRRPHTSVSSAVNALMEGGWIVDSGRRRDTRNKTEAIVWALTPAARQQIPTLIEHEQSRGA